MVPQQLLRPRTARILVVEDEIYGSFISLEMLHEFGKIFALQGVLGDRVPNLVGFPFGCLRIRASQLKNQVVGV